MGASWVARECDLDMACTHNTVPVWLYSSWEMTTVPAQQLRNMVTTEQHLLYLQESRSGTAVGFFIRVIIRPPFPFGLASFIVLIEDIWLVFEQLTPAVICQPACACMLLYLSWKHRHFVLHAEWGLLRIDLTVN